MTIRLPRAIEAYFDADRTGSPDAVAATFTENGIVKDEGKTHRGHDAIRSWMGKALREYSYTVEPFLITTENEKTQVTGHVVGTFPGSPIDLRYVFVLAGDKIAIVAANSVEYLETFMGGLRAGACVVPLSTMAAADALEKMLDDCDAKVLFLSDQYRALVDRKSVV